MAKEALREWQTQLAERMRAASSTQQGLGWLAVESRGRGLLFPLTQAGEVFSQAAIVKLAHSQPWLVGVANLRGRLHAVVDLGGFLGLPASVRQGDAPTREHSRYVAFGATIDINCALQIDRLCGLRDEADLRPDISPGTSPGARQPRFVGGSYKDGAGRPWQEIDLAILANDESFLSIAA